MNCVILADGQFPVNETALNFVRTADVVVCCDGAVSSLLAFGRTPDAIVGDMDSLSAELRLRFQKIIHPSSDQETNDLTKAVNYCKSCGYDNIVIVGATGKREDHTIGNIALLVDYAKMVDQVSMVTDYGVMEVVFGERTFNSKKGRQVSLFSLDPTAVVTTSGLLYPLARPLTSWWQGTLNEVAGDSFSLKIDRGCLIVYLLDEKVK